MKKVTKLISTLLAATLVNTSVSATIVLPPVATPAVISEEISLREQNTKHFQLSDGSYTAVVYDEPVHYKQEDDWIEIDNSLVSASLVGEPLTGTIKRDSELTVNEKQNILQDKKKPNRSYNTAYYENNTNDFNVHLPKEINSNMPIVVNYGGYSLRFHFNNITNATAEVVQPMSVAESAQELQNQLAKTVDSDLRVKIQNDFATAVQKNRSSVSYLSVNSNIDLNYHVYGQTLKEDIVFNSLPSAESFSFDFTYTGLSAVLKEDKSVVFNDESGKTVFVIAAPFMFDSDEGYSSDIQVTLEKTVMGCRYTLTPDRKWLEAPSRVYPITLDPQVTTTQNSSYIHDNGVQESDPDKNYITTNRMYVGSGPKSTQGRIYFKLTQWPSATGLNSNTITSAYLYMNYYPTASYQTAYQMYIDIYRLSSPWDTNTITWSSQTRIGGTQISSKYLSDSRNKTSGSDSFDVTAWVKSHYSSPSTDYGIRLQPRTVASSINRACYISSDHTSTSLRPIIYINYTSGSGSVSGLTSGQTYYLRNANSGKYLDVPNGNSTNGTDLIQYYLKGGNNQQFKLVYNSTTCDYSLSPVCAPNSAIEITSSSSTNDAIVQIWAKPSSGVMNSQRFNIVRNSDGSYRLLSYASNYTKAVVVQNASKNDSASIIQYTNNGSTNGFWFFEPANKTIKTNSNTSANSNYNREWAANYAITYGPNPHSAYKYFGGDGGDCTNFVSQCLYAGTMPMLPSDAFWGITSKSNIANWFYIAGVAGADWYTVSFTSATNFNKHWGQTNMRAYQTIEYASGNEALKDIDFLMWYLKKGDIIQLKYTSNDNLWHSMIICNDNVICDGKHKGVSNTCPNVGKRELLYAQHSSELNNGHLRALLKDNSNRIVFTKIKKDV